ncbi:MAG: stalk domain-containing protein, partial [Candidatus Woesearchaeota archaeon]
MQTKMKKSELLGLDDMLNSNDERRIKSFDVTKEELEKIDLEKKYYNPLSKTKKPVIMSLIAAMALQFGSMFYNPKKAISLDKELPKVTSVNPEWYSLEKQPLEALIREIEKTDIRVYIGSTEAKINEQNYSLDAAPYIKNGRTLVPLRFIAEGLGASVGWDGVEKKVTIYYEDKTIELWIGKKQARVNGIDYALDVAPEITKGRTFVPIRFIAENFGSQVLWNSTLKEVSIIKEKEYKRINENSDADNDGVIFKDEKTLGTNPNDKNTVYNSLTDKQLFELKQKYPNLNIFSAYPDGITKLTLPEKYQLNLNPVSAHNLDQKINDEIIINYALNKNPQLKTREELESIWQNFNTKYSSFIDALKENLNLETTSTIEKAAELILNFKNLKLDEKLKTQIDKEYVKRVLEEMQEFNEITPLVSSFNKEFVNQNKNFFSEIKNTTLDFIAEMLTKYPELTIQKQIELNNKYPELDFSLRETFENPDKVSGLSLQEKTKYNINPLSPNNFDDVLNDKKAIEYAKVKNLSGTKEDVLKAIKTITENYGQKLGTAAKQLLNQNKIEASELDAQATTAKTQVEAMFNARAYKTKSDGTKITLEDLTTTERYKTLMLLNKTFGKEDINILLAQSKTLSQNPELYSELINTLKTASHKIEEPVNQEIKDLRVFKNYINQWGLYDNNAGELAVKLWNSLSQELREEVKQHPKLFLSYVGKYRAWAEAGKVKIGSKEYDFREVFDDIVKFTKDQIGYVIKMEKYFQEKGYELYEYSGYGREIENLPFIWMQGSPFTPGLSHIELIKNKLSAGKMTLK